MIITTELIKSFNPCKNRLENYLLHYADKEFTLEEFLALDKIICGDKIWVSIRLMSRNQQIEFACQCAESVLHIYEKYNPDSSVLRNAISCARDVINGLATASDAGSAADAAWTAACAACDARAAARAAAWAAGVAGATTAATFAADAARAAARAAEAAYAVEAPTSAAEDARAAARTADAANSAATAAWFAAEGDSQAKVEQDKFICLILEVILEILKEKL